MNKGFTLIEIVVTLTILMILMTGSFVGFNSYNRTQKLNSAANDLKNTLNEAKSYTSSQAIVSSGCDQSTETLVGKKIYFINSNSYRMEEICRNGGSYIFVFIKTITLPSGVTINQTGNGVEFHVESIGDRGTNLASNFSIVLTAGATTRTVTVTPDGIIK